jgi:ribonucleotide monophosphatase NagD (HAD superfamily)
MLEDIFFERYIQMIKPVTLDELMSPLHNQIFAVDFDGTVVDEALDHFIVDKNEFKEIPGAIKTMKALQSKGAKIILWTCRDGEVLQAAVDWLKDQGFVPDAINENIPGIIDYKTSGKVFANYYLDNRSYPAFTGWDDIKTKFEL